MLPAQHTHCCQTLSLRMERFPKQTQICRNSPRDCEVGEGPRGRRPRRTAPACAGCTAPKHSTAPPSARPGQVGIFFLAFFFFNCGASQTTCTPARRSSGGLSSYPHPLFCAFSTVVGGGQDEEQADKQVVEGEDLGHHGPLPAQPGGSKQASSQNCSRTRTCQPDSNRGRATRTFLFFVKRRKYSNQRKTFLKVK